MKWFQRGEGHFPLFCDNIFTVLFLELKALSAIFAANRFDLKIGEWKMVSLRQTVYTEAREKEVFSFHFQQKIRSPLK